MSLRTLLTPPISAWLLSEQRLLSQRARAERRRLRQGRQHEVLAFVQVDDPYSAILAQVLPALQARYAIRLMIHLVPPPDAAVAPERELLSAYARRDAAGLAQRLGLRFDDPGCDPTPAAVREASMTLWRQGSGPDADLAARVLSDLWCGGRTPAPASRRTPDDTPSPTSGDTALQAHLNASRALRDRLGHYQGAMLHYAGEWYWGVDRLHHLERRLQSLGTARPGVDGLLISPRPDSLESHASTESPGCPRSPGSARPSPHQPQPRTLDFFFSLRSPYSAIATPRVMAMAAHAEARIRWRYVLPMVMRGLPVPAAKRRYIAWDAACEARWHGVPFGRLNDPVGRPTERGLALMPWAEREGRIAEYVQAFMQGVWAQGLDAGSDRGLRRIVEAADLSWSGAKDALTDTTWRAVAEANRAELFSLGLWGVPSMRTGALAVWGQDRLAWIGQALADPDGVCT